MGYIWIKEFGLLESILSGTLERDVNKYINDGWKPQGGLSVSVTDLGGEKYYFASQAMVKEA
jgi:hypothetical protein